MGSDLFFSFRPPAVLAAVTWVWVLAAIQSVQPAYAAEGLKPGPGAALAAARCSVCHELEHITRSNLSREQWEDTLALMTKRGLVVTPEEKAQLLDYLSHYYGADTANK